jgi:pimeloyl-[acyl-carrier protein] methyl ester esterase
MPSAPVLLLLPGMDGTGRLFARLSRALAPHYETRTVAYPPDRVLGYDELVAHVAIPRAPFAVVAESFSGPVGIALAAAHAGQMVALVLAGSFARSPYPRIPAWLSAIAHPALFALSPPRALLRRTLLGPESSQEDVDEVREILHSVRPEVIAARLRAIARVDVRAVFAATTLPTLYLRAAKDRLVPRRVSRELHALRSDLEEIELDAPHFLLQERPALAAAAIKAFLDRRVR